MAISCARQQQFRFQQRLHQLLMLYCWLYVLLLWDCEACINVTAALQVCKPCDRSQLLLRVMYTACYHCFMLFQELLMYVLLLQQLRL